MKKNTILWFVKNKHTLDIQTLISENLDIILIIITIIASLLIMRLVTKILFRLIIVLVIAILSLITYQQFANTNIIDDIQTLYCNGKKSDPVKCTCFVKPIIIDLETRFSQSELETLKSKKLKVNTEFMKSYKRQEAEIKNCFETIGDSSGILEEIFKDIKKAGLKILK